MLDAALTVGVDHLVGELAGGIAAWTAAGRDVAVLAGGPDDLGVLQVGQA